MVVVLNEDLATKPPAATRMRSAKNLVGNSTFRVTLHDATELDLDTLLKTMDAERLRKLNLFEYNHPPMDIFTRATALQQLCIHSEAANLPTLSGLLQHLPKQLEHLELRGFDLSHETHTPSPQNKRKLTRLMLHDCRLPRAETMKDLICSETHTQCVRRLELRSCELNDSGLDAFNLVGIVDRASKAKPHIAVDLTNLPPHRFRTGPRGANLFACRDLANTPLVQLQSSRYLCLRVRREQLCDDDGALGDSSARVHAVLEALRAAKLRNRAFSVSTA